MQTRTLWLLIVLGVGVAVWMWLDAREREDTSTDSFDITKSESVGLDARGQERTKEPAHSKVVDEDNSFDPRLATASERMGIEIKIGLIQPMSREEAWTTLQGLDNIKNPAVGYPIRAFWHAAEPISSRSPTDTLQGKTNAEGVCSLAPLVVPHVGRHLWGSLRLVIEGGGHGWDHERLCLSLEELYKRIGTPRTTASEPTLTRWLSLDWRDWKGTPVSGRVVHEDDSPVVGLQLVESACESSVITDGYGRFTLRCATGKVEIFARTSCYPVALPEPPITVSEFDYRHSTTLYSIGGINFESDESKRRRNPVLATLHVTSDAIDGLELSLPERTRIRGRVLSREGRPVAGLDLWIGSGNEFELLDRYSTESNSEGVFEFLGLDPVKQYKLFYGSNSKTVSPGDLDIELRVARNSFTVQLVDLENGKPVENACAQHRQECDQGRIYEVLGWAPGYGPVSESYETESNAVDRVITLKLPRAPSGASLLVRCLAPDGSEIPSPRVVAHLGGFNVLDALWIETPKGMLTHDIGPGTIQIAIGNSHRFRLSSSGRTRLGHPGTSAARFLLDHEQEVTIPSSGKLTVDMRPKVGGAIEWNVAFTDPSHRAHRVPQPLLIDEQGVSVEYNWFDHDGYASSLAEALETSAIPVGTYRLKLDEDWHRALDQVVHIEAGKLTPVNVLMEPKGR